MMLIVGLGNPGDKYKGVRHNLGFEIVDEFSKRIENGKWVLEEKFKAEVMKYGDLLLVKPQTFMNQSGVAVSLLANFYKISVEDVIVIHDDLDILLGKLKVRTGGAAAGHHGVESIIDAIGDGFTRLRVGIGNEKSHLGEHQRVHFNAEHFVLEPFIPVEKPTVKHVIKQAIKELEIILHI